MQYFVCWMFECFLIRLNIALGVIWSEELHILRQLTWLSLCLPIFRELLFGFIGCYSGSFTIKWGSITSLFFKSCFKSGSMNFSSLFLALSLDRKKYSFVGMTKKEPIRFRPCRSTLIWWDVTSCFIKQAANFTATSTRASLRDFVCWLYYLYYHFSSCLIFHCASSYTAVALL